MHRLTLTPDESRRIMAGATLLVRPVELYAGCWEEFDPICDDGQWACKCGDEYDSPFPPPGEECYGAEAWQVVGGHAEARPRTFRFRIASLDVKRAKDHLSIADFRAMGLQWDDSQAVEGRAVNIEKFIRGWYRDFRDWWTDHYPDAPFDTSWCWVCGIEHERSD